MISTGGGPGGGRGGGYVDFPYFILHNNKFVQIESKHLLLKFFGKMSNFFHTYRLVSDFVMVSKKKPNWVYCLQTHNDTFKVGGSCDILTRLGSYKGDNRPRVVFYAQVFDEFREVEREIIDRMKESGRFALIDGNEWFRASEGAFKFQHDIEEFFLDIMKDVSHLPTCVHRELKLLSEPMPLTRGFEHCYCGGEIEYCCEDFYMCLRCEYSMSD